MEHLAWIMDPPQMFGELHVFLAALYIGTAILLTRYAIHLSYEQRIKIFSYAGWVLLASEVFKQIFVYQVVCGGVYNFWYIPFQLCSIPMYLCILLPHLSERNQKTVLTFMLGYTFVSAVATFIIPEDILRPYIILTLHGFDWHAILLFISLTIGISGMADTSFKGFMRATYLFLALCAIAVVINIATEMYCSSSGCGIHGYANMFYLSPYHTSNQPIVTSVEASLGRVPAMLLYIAAVIAASGGVNYMFGRINRHADTKTVKR